MSTDEQDVEVIQGRLGWEGGDISEAKVDELSPHRKNEEIYGDTDPGDLDDTFLESIREKGVLEPLVITDGKRIISGHRRWNAAKAVGVETVPVRKSEFDSELAEREAVIEFNRQREKTPGQIVNEFEEILEIEKDRAAKRRRATQNNNSASGVAESETFPEQGEARDKAAEKANASVSGRTLEKGLKVKEKAEQGDETAQQEWDKLQSGEESFNGAYTNVKEAEQQADDPGESIEQFTSQQTDEWSSPPELVRPIDDAIGGFDLDPCSGAEGSPFAESVFTKDDNGLSQSWFGDVWVNPPYSDMGTWSAKAVEEAQRDAVDRVVFLCKGDSSTDWWQDAASGVSLILAIDRRLSFGDGENSAPFASHVFVFGDVTPELASALGEHGTLLSVGWGDE